MEDLLVNKLFFVRIEDAYDENGEYAFSIKKVKQLKPTLSVHVKIIPNNEFFKEYYYELIERGLTDINIDE